MATEKLSIDEKLERRKLDALKRGIHRIGESEKNPFELNFIGVGDRGVQALKSVLKFSENIAQSSRPNRCNVVSVSVDPVSSELIKKKPITSSSVNLTSAQEICIGMPDLSKLEAFMTQYPSHLTLEYPRFFANPNYQSWLPERFGSDGVVSRISAKTLYSYSYYQDQSVVRSVLKKFARTVNEIPGQSVAIICFGLDDNSGSGVVMDLARHLTNTLFGRGTLVVGIGIGPQKANIGANLYPVLNELDCLADLGKNAKLLASYGDLYQNPFTGGFFIVPSIQTDEKPQTIADHQDEQIAQFLLGNQGNDFWETLRLLSWVGAPPTQHSAARTQYGLRWAHILGNFSVDNPAHKSMSLRDLMGIKSSYRPEYIEIRANSVTSKLDKMIEEKFNNSFQPLVAPTIMVNEHLSQNIVQFILPCIAKMDLTLFDEARKAYETIDKNEKLDFHALLADLGVNLSEPSDNYPGFFGECKYGGPIPSIRKEELIGN